MSSRACVDAHKTSRLVLAAIIAIVASIAHADLVIKHVTVIPMTRTGDVMTDMTIVMRKDRIVSISPASTTQTDTNIATVDARGKFLMPALADMHTHLENDRLLRLYMRDPTIPNGTVKNADALLPYIANGVLQIAVLTAMPETIAQRDEVERGRVLGPHIALAAMIDGSPPFLPVGMTRVAVNPSDGRQAVRDVAAEGYEIVKTYSRLDDATFLAIVDEARKLGLKVTGHLPRGTGNAEARFVPGFGMVAHAEEFAHQANPPPIDRISHYANLAKASATWLTSTLTANDRILEMTAHPETLNARTDIRYLEAPVQSLTIEHNPYLQDVTPGRIEFLQRVVDFNRKLIPAFAAAGIPIVAGTDSLLPGIVAGFALHDELEALAAAGLSNKQVLESATRLPAEWLGTIDDRGEIAVGKRADLLLLDADPLVDVKNSRRIAGVIVSGAFLSRDELDVRMEALKKRAQTRAAPAAIPKE